jgi:hypothetical protein
MSARGSRIISEDFTVDHWMKSSDPESPARNVHRRWSAILSACGYTLSSISEEGDWCWLCYQHSTPIWECSIGVGSGKHPQRSGNPDSSTAADANFQYHILNDPQVERLLFPLHLYVDDGSAFGIRNATLPIESLPISLKKFENECLEAVHRIQGGRS